MKTDVYPVGVLAMLLKIWRALTHPMLKMQRWSLVKYEVKKEGVGILSHVKSRNWLGLRVHFGGYVAQHDSCFHESAYGWTKTKAVARVEELCSDTPLSHIRWLKSGKSLCESPFESDFVEIDSVDGFPCHVCSETLARLQDDKEFRV